MHKFVEGQHVYCTIGKVPYVALYKGPADVAGKAMAQLLLVEPIIPVSEKAQQINGQFYLAPVVTLEPLAMDVYQINDLVASAVGNSSNKYRVTGFEPASNRVVVVGVYKAAEKDRSRYAYKINELNNLTRTPVKLVPGRRYWVNFKMMTSDILCLLVFDPYQNQLGLIALEGTGVGNKLFTFPADYVPDTILDRNGMDKLGIITLRGEGIPVE